MIHAVDELELCGRRSDPGRDRRVVDNVQRCQYLMTVIVTADVNFRQRLETFAAIHDAVTVQVSNIFPERVDRS
mgnify:CR=1 FL=1